MVGLGRNVRGGGELILQLRAGWGASGGDGLKLRLAALRNGLCWRWGGGLPHRRNLVAFVNNVNCAEFRCSF